MCKSNIHFPEGIALPLKYTLPQIFQTSFLVRVGLFEKIFSLVSKLW